MQVNLAHLAYYLSKNLAIICHPVDLSLLSKLSSPVESSKTAVLLYLVVLIKKEKNDH